MFEFLKPQDAVYDEDKGFLVIDKEGHQVSIDELGILKRAIVNRIGIKEVSTGLIWREDVTTVLRPEGDLGGPLSVYHGPIDSESARFFVEALDSPK